ncbi:MAG: hypothetical protein IPK28_10330 [Devosia sp.]|nr:hypothetical protein [Devosia sp.]
MLRAFGHAGLLVALLGSLSAPASAAGPDLSRLSIEDRAEAAARYLVATETEEGRFFYEFDFLKSRFGDADNIVRQAAAGYVLNQFYFSSGLSGFSVPAARTIAYYEKKSVPNGSGLILSEDGTIEGGRAGGAALALLAELFHSRALGFDYRPDLRAAWVRGLAAQQLKDGDIAQRPGETEPDSYATGETWLALAHHADLAPDDAAANTVLDRLEQSVMTKYLVNLDREFAHWGLMAATQRFRTTGEKRYLDFIEQSARRYLRTLMPTTTDGMNGCAALEGLIAAATALADNPTIGAEVRDRLERELPSNLNLQLRGDGTRLHFGPDRYYEDPKLKTLAGAFLNGAFVLRARIDATQHCLSALLHYRELAEGEGKWMR